MTSSRTSGETAPIPLPRGSDLKKERECKDGDATASAAPPSAALLAVSGGRRCREARPQGAQQCGRAAEPAMNQLPQAVCLPRAVRLLPGAAGAARAPGETEFPLQWETTHAHTSHALHSPPHSTAFPMGTLPLPPLLINPPSQRGDRFSPQLSFWVFPVPPPPTPVSSIPS